MTVAEHAVNPEEVMGYLDGELQAERAAVVHAHMTSCDACQRLAGELRAVSREVTRWSVEDAPAAFTAPLRPPSDVRSMRWFRFAWRPAVLAPAAAVAGVLLVAVFGPFRAARSVEIPVGPDSMVQRLEESRSRAPAREREGQMGAVMGRPDGNAGSVGALAAEPSKGPMVTRTVTLRIVAKDFDSARPAVDRILRDVSGFVGQISASAARGSARSLTATLRVPADRLDAALAALKGLGQVVEESQGGDDVTEQAVDLDARLTNARNTEKRLTDVLQHRTGKVGDVLEVEREIARVRGEIERMDAERKNLARRVAYATVTLEILEERRADLDLGPLPVSRQFRNAIVDGFRGAFESALGLALFGARVGPALLLWGLVLAWPVWLVRRRYRGSLRG